MQIATGSYTGNGQAGEGSPNSITLPFAPKLVVLGRTDDGIFGAGNNNGYATQKDGFVWVNGIAQQLVEGNPWTYRYYQLDGTVLKWWGTNQEYQANMAGQKYVWFAIG